MNGSTFRVGQGFDVHPWGDDPNKPLVLGGVTVPGLPGLVAHSDGDVITHACIDAVLGAAGLGDIGQMFPDVDPAFRGADSVELLAQAVDAVAVEGWTVGNIDCTVVLDAPRIAPIKEQMQTNLERACRASVSIKGKRTEGLGSLAGGPHCWAVALIQRIADNGAFAAAAEGQA